MSSILISIAIICALISVMGLLSLFEEAVVGARRWRLREEAGRGSISARTVLRMLEDPDQFVNSVRLGIILAAIAAALYAGGVLCRLLEHSRLEPGVQAMIEAGGVAVVITLGVLFFGDLLPRRVAQQSPEHFANRLARPLSGYLAVAKPMARVLGRIVDVLARLFGVKPGAKTRVTHEEIKAMVWEGAQTGVFDPAEHDILKRAFRFCERRARGLMTPRDQVVWIDVSDSPEEIRRKVLNSAYTRFPVCDESLDNLLGIVQVKDLLRENSGGAEFRLKGHLTIPALIYEGARGPKVLETLRSSSAHTAVVLDEYGSVVGMITLSDILGAVLGDMLEHGDELEEPRSVQREDGSWLLDGLLPVDEFRDLFDLVELPEGDYQTLAGFVVTWLGHIPRISEHFETLGLRFEVVDMDERRVDRILVSRVPEAQPAE